MEIIKTVRWGILGCGNVTEVKSGPAYQLVHEFSLDAVMRRDIDKAKDYAIRHNVQKYYGNADELIQDPELDAIYIATPPDSHHEYAIKVAAANKICCIEKPMAPSYEECRAITEAFEKKKLPLFVAYYRRSLPRFQQLKKWLEDQEIGKIRHISWKYLRTPSAIDRSGNYNWRTDAKIALGGYFDDLASHGLDLFNYLLGDVKEAKGLVNNQQKLYSSYDAITGNWIYKKGITGCGVWNFGSDHYEDSVEIIGSIGRIEFSVFDNKPLVLIQGEKKEEISIENPQHIQQYHVENMMKALTDSTFHHPSTGKTATHTSWVMDKILGKI